MRLQSCTLHLSLSLSLSLSLVQPIQSHGRQSVVCIADLSSVAAASISARTPSLAGVHIFVDALLYVRMVVDGATATMRFVASFTARRVVATRR